MKAVIQIDEGDDCLDPDVWLNEFRSAECTITNTYRTPPPPPPPPPPTVTPVLDLQIDKTGSVTGAVVDGVATVEWTLTVSHGAGSTTNAVGASVSDAAPAGMTFTSVTSADMTCAIVDNAVACGPFNLALGSSATAVVTATAPAGTFENTATVSVQGDTVESNNMDDAAVEIAEVLPIEILPETGADTDRVAWVAGILLLMGAALVLGSRRGESFTIESTL